MKEEEKRKQRKINKQQSQMRWQPVEVEISSSMNMHGPQRAPQHHMGSDEAAMSGSDLLHCLSPTVHACFFVQDVMNHKLGLA